MNKDYEQKIIDKKESNDIIKEDLGLYVQEMLRMLISYQYTYDVLEEIFKEKNINLWNMIKGAFIGTFENKKLIEKITGKKWEEINEQIN